MTKLILSLIILLHIFILKNLVFFPYPELFIYPYLTNHGLKPYSQILDQHFPGLMFLPINLDNLGMHNEVDARMWLLGIVLITHILLFFISSKIFKRSSKALVVNLLYLIWQPFFEGWVLWIDNFLPLFLLPAFYFSIKKKFLLTGIFLGLGIVMKQTIIPLAGLLFLYILYSRDFKSLWKYIIGAVIPVGLMLLFIIKEGYFAHFWYWTVVFNLTTYAQFGTQIPNNFGFLSRVFVVYATSLLGFLDKDKHLKIILGIFLIGSLFGAFDRSNFVHFQPSLPFALIGTALGFYALTKRQITFVLIGLYLVIAVWWQNIFYKGHVSNKVFFFDEETYAISNKIRQYSKIGDKIFVFGAAPHLYQMSQTLPAGDIFVFQFPWFLKIAQERILAGVKKDQPEIVVADRSVKIDNQDITEFAKEIDQYIQKNYLMIDQIGSTAILRKISP